MIASFRIAGNVGFLIYIVDAWGYLGSMSVVLTKEILKLKLNWVSFYSVAVIVFAVIGVAFTITSFIYFNRKYKRGSVSWQENQPSLSVQAS